MIPSEAIGLETLAIGINCEDNIVEAVSFAIFLLL